MIEMFFVDVHMHLTHEQFNVDRNDVITRAKQAGIGAVIVNGLEPISNRQILALAAQEPMLKPALGIYPADAVAKLLTTEAHREIRVFDVDAEIDWIASQASQIIAIGECGLDGHWLGPDTFAEQERVFHRLIDVAKSHDLPLIVHTRKLEERAMDIIRDHGITRIDFHCFGGKSKLAIRGAEQHGWSFSIPAHARRSGSFTKLLRELPPESILTETDAPYLPPEPGARNEPMNVAGTVAFLAELRSWTLEQAKEQVWKNYLTLFRQ
jgi:TatD DNase family protein